MPQLLFLHWNFSSYW